jgi:hypothetical protein
VPKKGECSHSERSRCIDTKRSLTLAWCFMPLPLCLYRDARTSFNGNFESHFNRNFLSYRRFLVQWAFKECRIRKKLNIHFGAGALFSLWQKTIARKRGKKMLGFTAVNFLSFHRVIIRKTATRNHRLKEQILSCAAALNRIKPCTHRRHYEARLNYINCFITAFTPLSSLPDVTC